MDSETKSGPAGPSGIVLAPVARFLYLLLSGGVFLADRLTKTLIETALALHETLAVVPGFFHIVHVRNQGIAFGLLADSPSPAKTFALVFFSALALGGVALLLWSNHAEARQPSVGLALILGGALGNLFDRVRHGSVVDFLDFFVAGYHWPAFNLADSAIVVGGGLLLWHMGRGRK